LNEEPQVTARDDTLIGEAQSHGPENAPSPPNGVTKRSFVERFGSHIGLVTGLFSLIAVFLGWFFWLDRRVQDLVAVKIEPYRKMEAAISRVDKHDYDDAIRPLREAFKEFKTKHDQTPVPPRLVDTFLRALANTDDPIEHQPDFKMVVDELGETLPEFGWRLHEVAWYHFRTGKLKDARDHFNLALRRREYVEAADTYFALATIALVDGDIDFAISQFREAERRDPSQYSAKLVTGRRYAYQKAQWWLQLRRAYAKEKFGESLDEMIDRIEVEEKDSR